MDTTNNEAFENGYASGKTDGFDEAWRLAHDVFRSDYSFCELEEIFGTCEAYEIFDLPAIDVMTKIEEYKKDIKVGDVVKSNEYVGVVLQKNNTLVRIVTKNSTGNVVVAIIPVDETIKLAESVDSFSDMLGKIGYINE